MRYVVPDAAGTRGVGCGDEGFLMGFEDEDGCMKIARGGKGALWVCTMNDKRLSRL